MILSDIFEIEYGQRKYHDKSNLVRNASNIGIPLISSGGEENGLYGFFNIDPQYKDVISVANTGTICSAFYHDYSCCIDDNCLVLKPKKTFTKQEMLFFVMIIKQEKYKYLYGRQVTPKRLGETKIPSDIPEYVNQIDIKEPSRNSAKKDTINLDIKNWQFHEIKYLFPIIKPTKGSTTNELRQGNEIPYIAAKKNGNGLDMMCSKEGNEQFISEGNCIVFIQLGAGSAGYTLYQEKNFIGMNGKTSCGYNDKLNKYNALFLVTVLDQERPKFSFGRSWTGNRLTSTKIKLPTTPQGEPDWQFMEEYIKSLPYSSSL